MPGHKTEAIPLKIRRVVNGIPQHQQLNRRNKHLRIRMHIPPKAHAHGPPLGKEHPLVVRRISSPIIHRRVHRSPHRPINYLIKHRGRAPAVQPAKEVGGPDKVLRGAIDGEDIAELVGGIEEGERSGGGEGGEEAGEGYGTRGPRGDIGGVGEPSAAVDLGGDISSTIDQEA